MVKRLIDFYRKSSNQVKYFRSMGVKIGDFEIYPSASFGSEPYLISIGKNVRINANVQFITHDGGCWVIRNMQDYFKDVDIIKPIKVGNNVHIGTGVTIMPGVTIGNNCIIGVGAIVTRDILDNSIAVGVPARVIETIDDYLEKHKDDFIHTKNMSVEEKKKILIEKFK